jgi:hypothetical protein
VINVDETLHVLREIWAANGQDDIGCAEAGSCKRFGDVGFDALADEYDGDIRAAWRATLKREGKLRTIVDGQSV